MRRVLVPLVGAAVVCAAVAVLLTRSSSDDGSPPPAASPPPPSEPFGAAGLEPDSTPDPAPAPTVNPATDGPRLRGYVQSLETGEGIANASVAIHWGVGEDRPRRDLTTDETGEFVLLNVESAKYTIRVWHERYASERSRYTVEVEGGESPSDLIVWMNSGGAIAGRVVDEASGEGIPGVKVGLDRSQTRGIVTDDQGRYRIDGVRAGDRRIFVGKAKGYLESREHDNGLRVAVRAAETLEGVDFSLQRGVFAAIDGTVVNVEGEPVAGAEVTAVRMDPVSFDGTSTSDRSKRDGTFRLDELQVAGGFYVIAKSSGLVSEEVGPLGLTVDGIRDVVLTLRPTAKISGQVVDSNTGDPVGEPEFEVKTLYRRHSQNFVGGHPKNLDEEGRFEFADLRPGSYGLYLDPYPNVFRSGIIRPEVTVDVGHGEHVEDVVLTFDHQRYLASKATQRKATRADVDRQREERPHVGEVRGQVVHADTNEPVTTFVLYTSHSSSLGSRTVHDAEGRFTVDEQRVKTLELKIAANGFAPALETIEGGMGPQPVHDVTIRLRPGGVVEGVVVDTVRHPVAGAAIYIGIDPTEHQSVAGGVESDAVSGPDGTFRLDTLSSASTQIYAKHPSFAVGSTEVTASRSRVTAVDIVLKDGGSISGVVRRGGEPLRGQAIMILNAAGKNIQVTGNQTNEEGRYTLNHLAAGPYTLYTLVDDFDRTLRIPAVVSDGRETQVDFDFVETGITVRGAVTLDGESPRSINAHVKADTAQGEVFIRYFGGGQRGYELTNVPAGDISLEVSARLDDGRDGSDSIPVRATGGEVLRDVALQSSP